MAEGLNKWTGLGNLAADAELKSLQSGDVLNFRLACSERYQDKSGERKERTEFVTCALYGKRAAALAQYLTKGSQVLVEGRLHTRSWDVEGQKRYATEVIVTDVRLLGGRGGGGNGGGRGAQGGGSGGDYGGDPEDYQR